MSKGGGFKTLTMKLYTEEQVREAFDNGYKYASTLRPASIGEHYKYVENSLKSLTPIELPSDEEIDKETKDFKFEKNKEIFYNGAKWLKEQILNQNK